MTQIHVCPLSQIPATVRASGARSLVTLINDGTPVVRPREIEESRHLFVAMSDIVLAEEGHVLPAEIHVRQLIDFVERWDRSEPILIHCYAGVSRSTAAAFITACALAPERDELAIAQDLRARSATATPNRLMIEIADRLLDRRGRMVEAVTAIGRGEDCFEGIPFALDVTPGAGMGAGTRGQTMSDDAVTSDVAALPYEAAMQELESIVERLERGDVKLEESIVLYERGEILKSHCEGLLKKAEARIEKIILNRDGKPSGTAPLDV